MIKWSKLVLSFAPIAWNSSDYFESLLLPQLLRRENDSKQSDEFQAIAPRGFSLERTFWFSPLLKNQQLQIRRRTTLWMYFLQIVIIYYLFHKSKKARENSFSSSSFSFPDTFIAPASQLSSSSNKSRKILHLKHFKFFSLNLSPRVHFFAGSRRTERGRRRKSLEVGGGGW